MPDVPREENRGAKRREALPFTKLGPYEVQKKLGSGGMGTVYLGIDHRLRRKVALKVLTPEKAENQTLLKRFRAEAANAAQLRHENVVAIYDAGEDQGYNYITMEFIDGTDVQRLLDVRGRIPVRRSLEIVKQVTLALQHAEKSRIVHRDIKPANILITREGVVKLADLGLARSIEDALEAGITRAGMTVGTVDYMSPEQAQDSKSADARSDIYSLGCTWYQMLTGKPPFPEGNLTNKLRDHAHTKRPNPRDLNPDVPEGMVAVIQRMMAIKPRERYQSPTELLKELENPNILSESFSQKLFEDASSTEIPQAARAMLDDMTSEVEVPAAVKQRRNHLMDDDDEEDEESFPRQPSGRQPNQSGKQSVVAGAGITESGKRGAISGKQSVTRSQKNSVRDVDPHGRLSRREREQKDVQTWKWRGMTGFSAIVLVVVGVLLAGIIWDQVKAYVLPNESVVSQDLGGDPNKPPAQVIPVPNAGPPKPPDANQPGGPNPPGVEQPAKQSQVSETPAAAVATTFKFDWKQRLTTIPGWANLTQIPEEKLPRYSVGPAASPETQQVSLNAALASLGPLGGIIELAGEGPFPLESAVVQSQIVVIRAAAGTHPVISAAPGMGSTSDTILELQGGLFALQGISIHVAGESLDSANVRAVIGASNSLLYVKECEFRSRGTLAAPVAAIRTRGFYSGPGANNNYSWLDVDRCHIEGDGLGGVEVESPRIEGLVRGSLFACGTAPALTFRLAGRMKDDDSASLLVDHSTLASATAGLRLEMQGSGEPVPVGVGLVDSVVASQGDVGVLLSSKDWPLNSTRTELLGPLSEVRWLSKESIYTGWKHLLKVGVDDAVETDEPERWLLLYRQGGTPAEFLSDRWPATDYGNGPGTALNRWRGESVPGNQGKGRGCDVALLSSTDTDGIGKQRVTATKVAFNGPTVKIDARTEDVGKKISADAWGDGTTFVVSGSGIRETSPIVIKGKSARIEFVEEVAGLTMSPRASAFRPAAESPAEKSLIQVEEGYLEIKGGRFYLPNSDRLRPERFLNVERGGFALDSTQIEIPLDTAISDRILIGWNGPGSDPIHNQGIIRGCKLLSGAGTFAELSDGSQKLLVRNSLLVARDNLFNLKQKDGEVSPGMGVDLEQSTLAAGQLLFSVDCDEASGGLMVYADSCLFSGLMWDRARDNGSGVLGYADEAALNSISWQENRCGYDERIQQYLVNLGKRSDEKQELKETWIKHWGANRIRSPLSAPGMISYQDGAKSKDIRLTSTSYTLTSESAASRAGVNQLPIGAGKIMIGSESRGASTKVPDSPSSPLQKTPTKRPVGGL